MVIKSKIEIYINHTRANLKSCITKLHSLKGDRRKQRRNWHGHLLSKETVSGSRDYYSRIHHLIKR